MTGGQFIIPGSPPRTAGSVAAQLPVDPVHRIIVEPGGLVACDPQILRGANNHSFIQDFCRTSDGDSLHPDPVPLQLAVIPSGIVVTVGQCGTDPVLVIAGIGSARNPELFQISGARSIVCRPPRLVQSRQKKRGKDRDHGNYHKELYNGELRDSGSVFPVSVFCFPFHDWSLSDLLFI